MRVTDAMPAGLQPLLAPRSVAIVGASDDPSKTASRPLRYLRAGGFEGTIYPVARRATVMGEPAWPSLRALPALPEHAFILLPTDQAMEAVAEAVELGIPAVTVLASGFGESGAEGAAREARLKALFRGSRTRLLGPSSLGLVNLHRQTVLTANAAFAEPTLARGGLFVASQSGSMIGALASRGTARGVGFAALVSVGGEADLGIGEVCAAALDLPEVDSFALFLETIRDADAIRDFAVEAAARGKPVVAYKLGRSEAAAELAVSHTGALAGEDDVVDAFLRDCGIARVHTLEGLLEAPALLRRLPIRPAGQGRPAVAVVTTTGGGAAMVVDGLGVRGVEVRAPEAATRARLAEAGIQVEPGRILDLTLAGTRYDVMKGALDVLLTAPEYDLVVAVAGSSARFQPELVVRPVLDSAGQGKPLASFLVPEAPKTLAMLTEGGVPCFRTPEACADAIAAAFARRPPRRLAAPAVTADAPGRVLDELAASALLDRLGVPCAPAIAVPVAEAGATDPPFGWPVAVKALHPDVPHKTDAGGVVLGVASRAALRDAAAGIAAAVAAHRPGVVVDRVLVQPMRRGLGEVLLGYRRDPQVGPVVLLAAGGIAAEIHRDRSVRPAPVDITTAQEMIAEVRGLRLLEGWRGRPRGDLAALAEALVRFSHAASLQDPPILELEANPVLVLPEGQGVVAVDALARIAEEEPRHG